MNIKRIHDVRASGESYEKGKNCCSRFLSESDKLQKHNGDDDLEISFKFGNSKDFKIF